MTAYRFRYHIDEARRLIVFRVTGDVPSAVLNDKFIAAYRKIPDSARYDRLIDYRRYTGYIEFPDMEDFARKLVDALAFRRRLEFSRRAQEELRAELALQQCDPFADCGLADAELAGGRREAAAFKCPDKRPEAVDAVHSSFPFGIDHILPIP